MILQTTHKMLEFENTTKLEKNKFSFEMLFISLGFSLFFLHLWSLIIVKATIYPVVFFPRCLSKVY